MNENETDPRPADASPESSPGAGQSEQPTAAQPTVAQPTVGLPAAAPQSATPHSAAPAPAPAAPHPGGPHPGAPQSGAPQSGGAWQPSPWQQHTATTPYTQQGYQQHPGYQHAGYAQHAGYDPYSPESAYAAWSQRAAQTQTMPQPAAEGQPAWTPATGEGQPIWVPNAPVDQRPPGRGRKVFVAGAAAVLIALGAGGVGAATALALSDGNATPTVQTGNSSVTRVVDRSSLAQIAAAVQDSVVSITTGSGEGSGVILSADGYIVTNNHVVATAQGNAVTVIFADGKKAQAAIVGTDPRTDLAVVKASGVTNLKAAKFGSSANMQVGDTVLAIGSPLGLEGSVTAGIISAKDRTIHSSEQGQSPFGQQQAATTMSGLLQTDAPINPGNSGGALVNTNGEVIGINSAIATQGQGSGNIGLGFAIPSDKAKHVADDLMAGRKVSHPALGVSVTDGENGGALVRSVSPNSAAAKAGLQQGDVITTVDGKAIDSSNDLVATVQAGTVGQQMTIEFTRDGVKKQISVTLTEAQ